MFVCDNLWTEGMVLLENPKGDNYMDMDKLRMVCSSVFGTNNTQLSFFSGKNGESNFSTRWRRGMQKVIHTIFTHATIANVRTRACMHILMILNVCSF